MRKRVKKIWCKPAPKFNYMLPSRNGDLTYYTTVQPVHTTTGQQAIILPRVKPFVLQTPPHNHHIKIAYLIGVLSTDLCDHLLELVRHITY